MKILYVLLLCLYCVMPSYAMQADQEKPPKKCAPRKKSTSLSLPPSSTVTASVHARKRSQSISPEALDKRVVGLSRQPSLTEVQQEGAMMAVIQAMSPQGPQEDGQHEFSTRPHTVSPVIRVLRQQRLSRAELKAAQEQIDSGSTQ